MIRKKTLIITGAILAFATTAGAGALILPQTSGADTPSPIVQQVNHNTDQLANHEARITNTENNVKDLQTKTNTPPSNTNTVVHDVTVPAAPMPVTDPTPTPPPAPMPVTVAKSGYLGPGTIIGHEGDCLLFYTDGTQGYITATVTVQNGSTTDNCQSFVGQPK